MPENLVVKPTKMNANPKPVQTDTFWRDRIYRTVARGGMLHQIIYDNSYDVWSYAQGETGGWLRRYMKNEPDGFTVLDAGCGYGALLCCFQEARLRPDYLGVDISPDLLELARWRYSGEVPGLAKGRFQVGDLRGLPFPDQHFDWVVARSVEGMIIENCGPGEWLTMRAELLRVGKKLLLLDYPEKVGDELHPELIQREGG